MEQGRGCHQTISVQEVSSLKSEHIQPQSLATDGIEVGKSSEVVVIDVVAAILSVQDLLTEFLLDVGVLGEEIERDGEGVRSRVHGCDRQRPANDNQYGRRRGS